MYVLTVFFDQINAALVILRDYSFKNILLTPNFWTVSNFSA